MGRVCFSRGMEVFQYHLHSELPRPGPGQLIIVRVLDPILLSALYLFIQLSTSSHSTPRRALHLNVHPRVLPSSIYWMCHLPAVRGPSQCHLGAGDVTYTRNGPTVNVCNKYMAQAYCYTHTLATALLSLVFAAEKTLRM